jgi:rRNA maturation RNase YbeY
MNGILQLRNRQRTRALNLPLLRRLIRQLLAKHFQVAQFELCFHFIGREEMAVLNETFLQHSGSTDVITFDHAEFETHKPHPETALHGELFISLDDAVAQARQFRTTWQAEVTRYVVHGLLHLCGWDDLEPAKRRKMKREEHRLMRRLGADFSLAQLARRSRPGSSKPTPTSRGFPLRKR